MDERNQLSPGAAIALGVVFEALAALMVLSALGKLPVSMSDDLQGAAWVVVCLGLVFAFGGGALIVGYGIAGPPGPDGELPPNAPFGLRVAQYGMGLGIVGSMGAVFTWVGFGSGPRHFSSSVAIPFLAWHGTSSERSGRIAFGVAAVLLWAMFALCGIAGARRLMAERRALSRSGDPVA